MQNKNNQSKETSVLTIKFDYKALSDLYAEKAKMQLIKMEEMLSVDDYMEWLEKFTNRHPNFNSNECYYYGRTASKETGKKVKDLEILFAALNKYSKENELYPELSLTGSYYLIQHNYVGYQIGYKARPGTGSYYCNRVKTTVDEKYTEFANIRKYIKSGNLSRPKVKQLQNQ